MRSKQYNLASRCLGALAVPFALASSGAQDAIAQNESDIEQVVVTATRIPEANDQSSRRHLSRFRKGIACPRRLGLADGLALVPGVEAPAGGDAGPSSSVPSFWGLHEFDAFLLIQDGIPWAARSILRFPRWT